MQEELSYYRHHKKKYYRKGETTEIGLSVVAPCYDEQEVIEEFHKRISAACAITCGPGGYEIVFVNDGSRDATGAILSRLASADPHVVCVDLFRNHGHQLAVSAGLAFAIGRRILLIDVDLQDPPELLPDLMRRMDEGFDVVYGQRRSRQGETAFKRSSASLFYRLLGWISSIPIPVDTGDFRLMTHEVASRLNEMPEEHRFVRGMVAWIGGRQAPMEYERAPRFGGETKYNLARMIRLAVDATTGFSITPLRFATLMSALAAAVALLLTLYVLISYLFFQPVPGWTSLGIIVLVFSAVQLFCMGLLGEYVGRTASGASTHSEA